MRNWVGAVVIALMASAAWASGQAGSLDPLFGGDGVVEVEPLAGVGDMIVWNTAVDGNGSVYVVGEALDTNESARRLVARKYDALGQQVSTYGGSGVAMPLAPSELQTGISAAVDADGQLLIAGNYIFDRVVPGRGKKTTTERINTGVILRLTDQGYLDTTFGPNRDGSEAGLVLLEDDRALLTTVSEITLLDNEEILVTGRAYVPGTSSGGGGKKKKGGGGGTSEANYAILLVKLDSNGDFDPDFEDGGFVIDNRSALDDGVSIGGTAVQSDGSIIVGSAASTPGAGFDVTQVYVRRYSASGGLDLGFGQDGTGEILLEDYTPVNGIPVAVDNLGHVLVGGAVSLDGSGGSLAGVVLRFLPDGKGLDPNFGPNGTGRFETNHGIEGGIRSIVALSDGSVVAAGPIWPNGLGGIAPEEYQILRLDASGLLDSTFGNGGYGEIFTPSAGYRLEQRSLVVNAHGDPVVAGNVYSLTNGEPPLPPFMARICGN